MGKKIATRETIKRKTISEMKELGTHKPQFNRIIDVYAGLVHEYNRLLELFESEGKELMVLTGSGSVKKSPIIASLETLRKDILNYSDRLMLNPRAYNIEASEAHEKTESLADLLGKVDF